MFGVGIRNIHMKEGNQRVGAPKRCLAVALIRSRAENHIKLNNSAQGGRKKWLPLFSLKVEEYGEGKAYTRSQKYNLKISLFLRIDFVRRK